MSYSRAKWRKQTRLQLLQQTQPQSHWRWISSGNTSTPPIQTHLATIPSIVSNCTTTTNTTPTRPSSSSTSSSRDSTALMGLPSLPTSLTSDRFGNAFPYLKPSTTNPFHSLFGLSSFHRTHTSIGRDFHSIPSLCSCTSASNLSLFPQRPTVSLPPIPQTNPLEFTTQTKSKESPKND